jgi:hypothetical protein
MDSLPLAPIIAFAKGNFATQIFSNTIKFPIQPFWLSLVLEQ